ncbi:MAG TPA: ribbon-helix-helix protein, CopG family [Acidimicrobiales bacterium]|nr:ribbon-helix-helix protein, CopG family [Acidimicrobiales bacterium]
MNLRLGPEAEEAVRAEAQRSGRSQQDVIREAVDRYLGLSRPPASDRPDHFGAAPRPRTPYRKMARRLVLPTGMTSESLLDRDDRF